MVYQVVLLAVFYEWKGDKAYFILKSFADCFRVEAYHHLIELNDYLGYHVRVVRHRLMASSLDASSETCEEVIEGIWVCFVIEFGCHKSLSQHKYPNIFFLSLYQALYSLFYVERRENTVDIDALIFCWFLLSLLQKTFIKLESGLTASLKEYFV